MLSVRDGREIVVGLLDKSFGLAQEAIGAFTGRERLREKGRLRQEAGSERLRAVEEEVKAAGREAQAVASETRQRARQPADRRSGPASVEPSFTEGGAEKVKGVAKQAIATVTRDEDLKAEGEAQSDKGSDQMQAAKHETRADLHRRNADEKEDRAERIAR